MRKILVILGLVLLASCSGSHVYHTIYGKVNTDTINVMRPDVDGNMCYKIKVNGYDTIYFKPYNKTYYVVFPTNDEHGNVVVQWNPQTGEYTSNW